MAHGYRSTEFMLTASSSVAGLVLVALGAGLAVEGARAAQQQLALVGLGLAAIGAALVAVLSWAYARSRGTAKSAPARIFAGRI